VNAVRKAGLTSLGELRTFSEGQLRALHGLGTRSIGDIRRFFDTCSRIEAGAEQFSGLKSVLRFFLNPAQHKTLVLRYGLTTRETTPFGHVATLQKIADAAGTTRERVRQIESRAKGILSTSLAQTCLERVHALFEKSIQQRHGAATCAELQELKDTSILDGYSPCRVLLLLSDCTHTPVFRNGFFTTVSSDKLDQIEKRAVEQLCAVGTPLPLEELLQCLSELLRDEVPERRRRVVQCTLLHFPRIALTSDVRCFVPETGTSSIIREIMEKRNFPMRLRTILEKFNAMMRPGYRRGAGSILEALKNDRQFTRTAEGYYTLTSQRGELQRAASHATNGV